MTEEEKQLIRLVVEETVASLRRCGALKDEKKTSYGEISLMLTDYFRNGQTVPRIRDALEAIEGDKYFDIIPLYFDDGFPIAKIAEIYGVDVTTIVRNKKRLCLEIFTLLI